MSESRFGEVLALIPARGGSKSVPRKNIIPLHGKPMIAWAIQCALESEYISRVIVTTDDDEISNIARTYGAEVPFLRPDEISGDFSTDIEFHRHALEWLKINEGYIPDMVVNLRPTPPSRSPKVIDNAIDVFAKHPEADSLRSVHLADQTPFKMWTFNKNGYMDSVAVLPNVAEPYNQPRQKLPLVYWQDGYIDITRPRVIYEMNSTTGNLIIPFVIDEPAVDIDYPDELSSAEVQLKLRDNKGENIISNNNHVRHPS